MNNKFQNIGFIIIVIFGLVSIAIFNYKMDSYGLWQNQYKYSIDLPAKVQPDMIETKIKLDKNLTYDSILIGSSDVYSSCKPINFWEINQERTAIYSLDECTTKDKKCILKNFYNYNYAPKVYIAINLLAFMEKDNLRIKEYHSDFITFPELYKFLFSKDSIDKSITKFISKYFNNKKENPTIEILPYRKAHINKKDKVNMQRLNTLIEIKDFLEENNIEIVPFITPLHALCIADIYLNGNWDYYIDVKKQIANIFPYYYDFTYFSHYNTKPLMQKPFYFLDVMHASPNLGEIMIKTLTKQPYADFGIYVTSENVNFYIEKQTEEIKQYLKTNKDEMDDYFFVGISEGYRLKEYIQDNSKNN